MGIWAEEYNGITEVSYLSAWIELGKHVSAESMLSQRNLIIILHIHPWLILSPLKEGLMGMYFVKMIRRRFFISTVELNSKNLKEVLVTVTLTINLILKLKLTLPIFGCQFLIRKPPSLWVLGKVVLHSNAHTVYPGQQGSAVPLRNCE